MNEFGRGRIQLLEKYLGAPKTLLYFQKMTLIQKVLWKMTPNHLRQNLFLKREKRHWVFALLILEQRIF
jgi:hypothetical protein